jgi:CheY-like chemotaxis protein
MQLLQWRLFVVDSSPAVQRLVEQASGAEGFEVIAFRRAVNALDALKKQKPDLVIADYHLEDMSFPAFCERLTSSDGLPGTPIITLLGSSDRLDERQMQTLGVRAILKKPLQAEDLIEVVRAMRDAVSTDHSAAGNGIANGTSPVNTVPPPVLVETKISTTVERRDPEAPPPPALEPVVRLSDLAAKPAAPPPKVADPLSKANDPMTDAMRGIFAQLLQSVTEQSERAISTRLPELVGQEVQSHLSQAMQAQLLAQVETTQSIVDRLLPTMVGERVSAMEGMIQQTVKATVGPLVKELVEKQTREALDATLPSCVAQALKEHMGRVDQLVKEIAEESAMRQARDVAETVVRDVAHQVVKGVLEQAMREITSGLVTPR